MIDKRGYIIEEEIEMRKLLKRLKKEEKGFTLIELLAVIVILAVIAVIAVPLIGKIIDNTKADSDVATARQVYDAAKLYITGEKAGVFEDVDLSELTGNGYLASDTALPSTKRKITSLNVDFTADVLQSVTLSDGTKSVTITAAQILEGKAGPSPSAT